MDNITNNEQMTFPYFTNYQAIKSLRDSGYKSTAHALAELIDNSIEANASEIEIIAISRRKTTNKSSRIAIDQLAILDNGAGMDDKTLWACLSFGYGTREERKGIGRFGFGLPNASFSQAKKIDVYSWQTGAGNALHTSTSISDIEAEIGGIPFPKLKQIPEVFLNVGKMDIGSTGTLIVWSELDKFGWKQATTAFKHSELLIGRLYRRFLAKKSDRLHPEDSRNEEIGKPRKITFIPIEATDEEYRIDEENIRQIRPNDPLYLMTETSCPEDFGPGPMFKELEGSPFSVPIKYAGNQYNVLVRASYAKPYVRNSYHEDADWPENDIGKDAGNLLWGKHANANIGVSLVRSHREIEIDKGWIIGYNPTERWWSIEVDFPTELDEVFGLTNNKQAAIYFNRMANFNKENEILPDEDSYIDMRNRMEEDGDQRILLLDLERQIRNAITSMRKYIKQSGHPRKRHANDQESNAELIATTVSKRRRDEGHKSDSDLAEEVGTKEQHIEEQIQSLVSKHHYDEKDALQRVMETVEANHRVRWITSHQDDSDAFFSVESYGGVMQVVLNTAHPVHEHLYEVLHPDFSDENEVNLENRIEDAAAAFRLLIYSWARYESELTGNDKKMARRSRTQWGIYADEFFEEDDGTPPLEEMY